MKTITSMRCSFPNQFSLASIVTACVVAFSGCQNHARYPGPTTEASGYQPPPTNNAEPSGATATDVNNYATVKVFYATDRDRTSNDNPQKMFGVSRGDISYGICDVSIPRDHRMGRLESPSIWKLEFQPDPEKHVVLLKVSPQERGSFFESVRFRVQSSTTKSAFLFIHGYNVTFEDAARRTAQLAYDLGIDAAPVFYSWPSQGTLIGYPIDEANIEWSQGNFEKFLNDFAMNTDAENIYLIAHSMGNRALTRAFAALIAQHPIVRAKFKELILMAPDIDATVFKRDIAPAIVSTNAPYDPLVTLYTSASDEALVASKKFHGYQRLGDSRPEPVILPGMDTVDVTSVDTSLIGHSYFGEERSVISDMFYLIRDATSVSARPRAQLRKVGTPPEQYWEFKP